MRSSTETLIGALRILSRDIQSGDGVANMAIAEAADRMEEMQGQFAVQVQTINHWKSNHDSMVVKAAMLSQRPDLPVDRIPAYRALERLMEESTRISEYSKLFPAKQWNDDDHDVLMFHFENFEEAPEVKCGGYGDIPENDPEYWTHFVKYDFNIVMLEAINSMDGGQS